MLILPRLLMIGIKRIFSLIFWLILIVYLEIILGTGLILVDLYCDEPVDPDLVPDSIYEPTLTGYREWWLDVPMEEKVRIWNEWLDSITEEEWQELQEEDEEDESNKATMAHWDGHKFTYFWDQLSIKQQDEFLDKNRIWVRIWGAGLMFCLLVFLYFHGEV